MRVYRIKNWSKFFENNKSKERDRCSYVCMPNKQDGMGLQRILAAPNGAAMFGVWCLLLQKASRQGKGSRDGWFTDDGDRDGQPWDFTDLGFQWRQDPALIQAAIDLFVDPRIGWLESFSVADSRNVKSSVPVAPPQSARLVSVADPGAGTSESGTGTFGGESAPERKKEEKERKKESPPPDLRDETDGADPITTRPEPLSDRQLIQPLVPWIRWRTADKDAEAENIIELAALVRERGGQVIEAAARAGKEATGDKLWPNEVEAYIPGPPPPPPPAPAPELVTALEITNRIGWAEVARILGFLPGVAPNEERLRYTLSVNPGACLELIEAVRA